MKSLQSNFANMPAVLITNIVYYWTRRFFRDLCT